MGLLVTIAGLAAAFAGAKRELHAAQERIDAAKRLAARQDVEQDSLSYEEWDALYAAEDLVRPTYSNITYLAPYESRRILALLLDSTRTNFLWAIAGLLVSTGASAASLFV